MTRRTSHPSPWPLRLALLALVGAGLVTAPPLTARQAPAAAPAATAAPVTPTPAIVRDLRRFKQMGTILYVAAHPDDENTQLIAYFSRARLMRSGYLSVTRGDGGQNLLGPEFYEKLGVARTQELLAARRLDGGRQFFTRAIDFGYTKDFKEALSTWDHDQVLADVVRVFRTFRPDVVVAGFSTEPAPGQHGQHTASAVLAGEAFRQAGDPNAFPDQLATLAPWQPTRLLQNAGGFGRGGRGADAPLPAGAVRVDIGGVDPATGEPLARIAGESRAMLKTQGFGNFAANAARAGGGPNPQTLMVLGGKPAADDPFDGIDTTWARIPGGADVGPMVDAIVKNFAPGNPAASVPALLALRARVARLPSDPLVVEKRADLDRILQACLGLTVETRVARAEWVPGEAVALRETAAVASAVPVQWVGTRYPTLSRQTGTRTALRAGQPLTVSATETLPAATPLSQPYWLREDGTTGMFRVDDASLIGRPENPPVLPVEYLFEVGGQPLVVPDEPMAMTTTAAGAPSARRLDVIPPVSLAFANNVRLFAPGSAHPVTVDVLAARAGTAGTLQLDLPKGWTASPASQRFSLAAVGAHATLTFSVTAPAQPATGTLGAHATIGGARYDTERAVIDYAHIPLELLQRRARTRLVALDLAIRGRNVGYLPGAGDEVPEALRQMGYAVRTLSIADLSADGLRGLDAVVTGVRAFNTRADLAARLPALFAWAHDGATVIIQYNVATGLQTTTLAPLALHISQSRVTDERATMTFLAPDHPVVTTPNRLTAADFDGWVQERGVYYADQWDPQFTPIFAASDPGEAPLDGGLLVARYGTGYYVYTSLDFFRQLPAGVPGAYRLFANLVSLGSGLPESRRATPSLPAGRRATR
jgi:LmbE family N-acetylglucosaminyl deacetylase